MFFGRLRLSTLLRAALLLRILWGGFRAKQKAVFSLAYLAVLFICLIPQIKYNYERYGTFSI